MPVPGSCLGEMGVGGLQAVQVTDLGASSLAGTIQRNSPTKGDGVAAHRRRSKKRTVCPYPPPAREHAVSEDNKIERKTQMLPIKGMSLYASTADYERRVSEDRTQAPAPGVLHESQVDNAKAPPSHRPR